MQGCWQNLLRHSVSDQEIVGLNPSTVLLGYVTPLTFAFTDSSVESIVIVPAKAQ